MTDDISALVKEFGQAAPEEPRDPVKPLRPRPGGRKLRRAAEAAAKAHTETTWQERKAAGALMAAIATPTSEPESPDQFKERVAKYQQFVGLVPTEPTLEPPEPKYAGRRKTIDSYTPETFNTLFSLLAEGYSLNRICMRDDMPAASTISEWSAQNSAFGERYLRARNLGLQRRAENLRDEIALHPDPIKAKLLFEHDKWFLSKMLPKVYGEKVEQHITNTVEHHHTIDISQLSADDVEALEGVLQAAKALPAPQEE